MPVIRARNSTHAPGQPREEVWISDAAGFTQFGAVIETLLPGERSSVFHWHAAEDEMVMVLEGEATLREGRETYILHAGDSCGFGAGVAVGHCIENRSAAPVRILAAGTRAAVDTITYPEIGRVCHRDRALPDDTWTDLEGNPAPCPFE